MSVVDFEVHLDQSENIELEGKTAIDADYLKTINKILPFETKEVARVILKNNWKLKSKFKLTMNVPDKDIQYSYIEKDEKRLEKQIEDGLLKIKDIPFEHLNKEEIDKILDKFQMKFIDLEFLPNDDAMVNPRYGETMKDLFDYVVHWRRPEDFCTGENANEVEVKDIKIFNYNEPEPNDIQQGILPDNHLASALSALAEKYNLIKRLFKNDQYSKHGIYQVKLCINGEWLTVIIDDFFPCIPLSNPLVSRSPGNELWVLILEKAIAKIQESYYSLININISDFFLILTGCPTLYINLEELIKTEGLDGCLKKIKQFVIDKKYLTVAVSKLVEIDPNENASEFDDDNMLTIPNFGYTILDVKSKMRDNLIVLRKVWYDGKKEEKVKKYEEAFLKANPLLEREMNEGTLILTFDDFLKEFPYLSVCYTKNWDEVRIRGKFVLLKEQESGLESVLSKWYYSVQLDRPTNLIISLHQDEDRMKENDSRKQMMDISITILRQDNNANEITHIESLDFTIAPNIQIELPLPPGNYIILPRTTGCFFGRPYEKRSSVLTPLFNHDEKKITPIFVSTIRDIFKKFDLLLNRKLGYNEFRGFWECVKNASISQNEFENNILNNFAQYDKGITEKGFINFFEDYYLKEGEKNMRSWLENLGYDSELYPLRSRCFMLTFHSDNPIAVSVRDALNTDLNSKVNKIILKSFGEEKVNKAGSEFSAIEYHSKNNSVVSVGILNKSNIAYKITLDFSQSKNLLFSTKNPKIEKVN
jgi:calpain-15